MSQIIDQRVVEMKFDNKEFEAGAATTMSTLQKLKKSLDFSKIGNSFENINKAANKVDMAGLDRVITGVENKFSTLEVMAITTLGNITNSFVNSAKRWISAFTIEPIKTGFQEYETQINAVQTILANTQKEGTNIEQVNAALDELNLYADKTIYNFTEMTRNIGTFTAAGVDLKTSVSAIQGIANLAAVSGSNSEQASRAMYQLSQALSTGTLRLMDWNSVVNAGMGGQVFQDALTETSRLIGTGADAAIEATGSFRASLEAGWLTSEVLTETLKKFTTSGAAEYVANYTGLSKEAIESELELAKSMYGEAEAIDKAAESLAKKSGKNKDEISQALKFAQTAEDAATKVKTFTQLIDTLKEAVQSGWSQSFRIIIGDFEEAKKLFTEISNSFGAVISASSDARNKLLSEVFNKKDAQDYMASIVDVPKEAIKELQTVAKEAGTTSDIFKNTLNEFTKGDEILNNVMTHMIEMVKSEKDVTLYISDITGISKKNIEQLQNLGNKFGYTSKEYNNFARILAKGNHTMVTTITHLLEMNNALTKPSGRELLIDSLRNAMKGLVSVIKPVQKAFREIFPPATAEQVYKMLEVFHEFTKTLRVSGKDYINLKKAFKGLFDIVKLLCDGFISLIKIIIPIEKPINSIGSGILDLVGFIGSLLSTFAKSIRSSKILANAFYLVQTGMEVLSKALSKLINSGVEFIKKLSKMKGTIKLINSLNNAFTRFYENVKPYIDKLGDIVSDFISDLTEFEGLDVENALKNISDAFEDLSSKIDGLDFGSIEKPFDNLKSKVKGLSNLLMSNKGFSTFVKNFKEYGEELKEAFTLDNLLARLEKVMDIFGKFFNWIKKTLGPAFADFNIGTAAAGAGGIGIVYAIIKMAKAFENISGVLKSIPNVLGDVSNTLVAYQKDLKASALIKTAGAIALLAGALVLLSFVDTERLISASVALALVSGVLIFGITKLLEAINKGRELNDTLKTFAKGFSSTMKKIGRALEIKAVGSAVKDFAESIAIIAVSIIALGIMWNQNPTAFSAALDVVNGIGMVLAGIIVLMTIASKIGNGKEIASIGLSVFMLTASLGLIVASLNKLMKIELPSDYGIKLGILGGIIGGLAGLGVLLALSAKIAGENQLPKMASTIRSLSVLLLATVLSLKLLFDIELPSDYGIKLGILGGIFTAFAALILIMGAAARISGGEGFKAASTILAMAGFLVVVVGALFVLTLIPTDKMLKGALGLGGVLTALGVALYAAGKITDKNTNKSIIAMAITIGTITAALAILSMIPFEKIVTSVISLGVILSLLAVNFGILSKMKGAKSLPTILGMIAMLMSITYSLYVLSEQPWESILAAGVSLSLVLIALTGCFNVLSMIRVNMSAIAAIIAGSAALLLIVAGISTLAQYDGQSLLNSCLALSAMLVVMVGVMGACALLSSVIGPAMVGVLGLGLVIAELALVLAAIGGLAQIPGLTWLIGEGGALLQGVGTAIGNFIGGIIGGVMGGISAQLPKIGNDLSEFMNNLKPFIDGCDSIKPEKLNNVKSLAGIILTLTGAEIVNGIANLFGLSLVDVAEELSKFMDKLGPFIDASKNLTPESMQACKYLAEMIIALTGAKLLAGIGEFFGLSGKLSDFASELVDFGPAISDFANQVKDVNPEAVEGAASAAKIMASVASELQGHGGFIQSIMGDKSLATFASELVDFGPAISDFANQVKDVKPEAVEGAAAAAEIMATVAEKLPNQGGLAAKIFGDNTLSEFGDELVAFGPRIAAFADQAKDVKPEAVLGVAMITSIMSKLANGLPDSDTLWEKIFGGGQVSLSEFGEELIDFGESMSDFSSSLTNVDTIKMAGVITSFKALVDLSSYIQDTSASNLVNFSKKLEEIGTESVNNFIKAFVDAGAKATIAINSLFTIMLSAVTIGSSLIKSRSMMIGNNLFIGIQNSINVNKPVILSSIGFLCVAIINRFKTDLPIDTFNTFGKNIVIWIDQGIDDKESYIKTSITQFCNVIISQFKTDLSQTAFKTIGENAAIGLKNGIENKVSEIANAATKVSKEAANASMKALDEHSPSIVMKKVGEFFSLGLAIGIINQIKAISMAGKMAAEEAIDPVKNAVNGIKNIIDSEDFDMDPVIRPVIDLSNVQKGAREINSLMNRTYDLSSVYNRAMDVSSSFNTSKKENAKIEGQVSKSSDGNTYEFNQYNYSPKALTRSEIYRQTNNQFSAFRRAVKPI